MTAEEVVAVLERLDAAGVEWWVDGGWGVDALLGEVMRSHDDLDLAVRREDCERVAAALPELRRVDEEWWPARFVLRAGDEGAQVDCHPLVFDEHGDGWQELPGGARGRYPAEDLCATGTIAGRPVRCVSARLQLAHHLYDDPDDVDWYDVRNLCRRFGIELPAAYRRRPGLLDPRRRSAAPTPLA